MAAMVASKRLLLISRWLRYPGCYINPAVKSSQSGCRQQNESSFFGGTGERSGRRSLSTATPLQSSEDKVKINFINRDGEKLKAEGKLCDSLLDVVIENNLDIDGFGACEGTLACSTCHLIFEESIYKKLDCITDEEMDMLDLAYSLTDTSRLGCQICLKKWMDGMTVEVPSEVSDARQTKDFSSYT
ncbi:adrenodoxin [Narcine bancroftii]|uniref:adrenodoxin n=1 Tax=Narcine bancroftii TaxID=1343680 RepID=UPI00383137AF